METDRYIHNMLIFTLPYLKSSNLGEGENSYFHPFSAPEAFSGAGVRIV